MRRYALAMAPLVALTKAPASGSAMVFASRGPCKQSRPPIPRRWNLSARRFASIPTCPPTDPSSAPPATLPAWGAIHAVTPPRSATMRLHLATATPKQRPTPPSCRPSARIRTADGGRPVPRRTRCHARGAGWRAAAEPRRDGHAGHGGSGRAAAGPTGPNGVTLGTVPVLGATPPLLPPTSAESSARRPFAMSR